MLRAIRNRWIFGKPIYVWAWVARETGLVSLGFTEDRRGSPLLESDEGWQPFGEPHTYPFGLPSDPDYNRHTNTWCRVIVAKMLTFVRRDGHYIAPPANLDILRFSTVQEFPKQDGSGFDIVTRWAYIWADQDPEILPREVDRLPIIDRWRLTKRLSIRKSIDREACSFWGIQYDLSVFKYLVCPLKSGPP